MLPLLIRSAVAIIFCIKIIPWLYKRYEFNRRVNKIPGPEGHPVFGSAITYMRLDREDRFQWLQDQCERFEKGIFRTSFGSKCYVHLTSAETASIIFRSKSLITKSDFYDFFHPWLGRGLITATGTTWHHHRRLITPTFHFKILEEFVGVITEKAEILKQCIESELKINPKSPINTFEVVSKCALDIICESAMGVNINAQTNPQSEYSQALAKYNNYTKRKMLLNLQKGNRYFVTMNEYSVAMMITVSADFVNSTEFFSHITFEGAARIFRPWLYLDWIYYRTSRGKIFKKSVDTAHKFTNKVISEKKLARKKGQLDFKNPNEDIEYYKPKRQAFLDHLLDACERENMSLTDDELRNEVETFLFAGHDTTATAMSWTLFCIGNNPEVEEKIREEQLLVFGDSTEPATIQQISELKYLERVIKESLRLFPSAPTMARLVTEDIEIGEYNIPKDAYIFLELHHINRNPIDWPNPKKFDPDRFLPENCNGRHPYAYVPFSAGLRNCVGQKFALLEEKIVLTALLRKWKVKSVLKVDEAKMYNEIILRPAKGNEVYFIPK